MTIYAFEVRVHRLGGGGSIINHRTRGGAMVEYLSMVREAWPTVQFTDLRARKVGPPQSSAAFLRTAARRGMAGVRCGDRAIFRAHGDGKPVECWIVGHNSSDNFDVLFPVDSEFRGRIGNVHPLDLELATKEAAA